jgi:hypothetical protein
VASKLLFRGAYQDADTIVCHFKGEELIWSEAADRDVQLFNIKPVVQLPRHCNVGMGLAFPHIYLSKSSQEATFQIPAPHQVLLQVGISIHAL